MICLLQVFLKKHSSFSAVIGIHVQNKCNLVMAMINENGCMVYLFPFDLYSILLLRPTCLHEIEYVEIHGKRVPNKGLLNRGGVKDIKWRYGWDLEFSRIELLG